MSWTSWMRRGGTAVLVLALAVGCRSRRDDDDDDDDLGPLLVLDAAEVSSRLARIEAAIPTCTTTGAPVDTGAGQDTDNDTDAVAAAQISLGRRDLTVMRGLLAQATDAFKALSAARRAGLDVQLIAGNGATGSCGGSLDVGYDHGDGTTVYTLVFADFCASGDVTDVTMNGTVVGKEIGTPSDDGPVISAFELDTEGPLAVAYDGGGFEVTATGVRSEFGNPSTWQPASPDADNPDVTRVRNVTFESSDPEIPDMVIRGLEWERPGPARDIAITTGVVGARDDGHVRVSTPPGELLVIDPLRPVGGAVILEGADDTQVVARPVAGEALSFELEVEGAPFEQGLDCSETSGVGLEIGVALLGALPIY